MPVRRGHVSGETRSHARRLRREMTPAEKEIWRRLRDRGLFAVRFRRQYPIEPYIVDFCCAEAMLVIEIDGDTHADSGRRDDARTKRLEYLGYRVIRFTNSDVHRNRDGVLEAIRQAVETAAPSP